MTAPLETDLFTQTWSATQTDILTVLLPEQLSLHVNSDAMVSTPIVPWHASFVCVCVCAYV